MRACSNWMFGCVLIWSYLVNWSACLCTKNNKILMQTDKAFLVPINNFSNQIIMRYERNNFRFKPKKSNQFFVFLFDLSFFSVSIHGHFLDNELGCSYTLVSPRICNSHKPTKKNLNYIFKQSKKETKKYETNKKKVIHVKIEGEKEAIHGEKDGKIGKSFQWRVHL